MMRFFITLATVVLLGFSAQAETGNAPPEPGIEAVISGQFDAFRANDYDAAFGFASPMIQGVFGSAERFRAMVTTGYPMVQNPGEVRFLDLREIDGALWQKVLLRDAAGVYFTLDYQMIQSDEGVWQINGVQLLKAAQLGA